MRIDILNISKKNISKDSKITFALCSRAIPEKGWDTAIEAMKIINYSYPNRAKLLLIGDGPYLAEAKNIVDRYELNSIIEFKGHVNDIFSELKVEHFQCKFCS